MDATRTVYLGQFPEARAEEIARRLEAAGIVWWHKQSGAVARFFFIGDWGVRLFVDRDRLDDARAIVDDVA